ncbi:MAG: mandelate racemase/muconate lactonizing enzyme family protein [Candidatus Latescibacteria bacterium]|nr:mandelate racemase/muconate lactonizing enzyme family protein [Candidatus Latescibacterota bacterium]
MKITRIIVHNVAVPPTATAIYRLEPGRSMQDETPLRTVIEVETDEGLIGLGESRSSAEALRKGGQPLLGTDPRTFNLRSLPIPQDGAYDIYEMAMYDLVGKATGLPTCHLLGGPYRHWVSVHYWMGKRTPEESARIAKEGWAKGFKGVKVKVGHDRPEEATVDRVVAIREAVGETFEIVLDANGGYETVENVRRIARELEPYDIVMLEDPVHRSQLDAFEELNGTIPIPLALHVLTMEAAVQAVKRDLCTYMNVGYGDMARFVLACDIVHQVGIPTWHGSAMELGIRDASYLHACAAAKGCTLSSDILHHLWEDDLILTPITIVDGMAEVPMGLGLGVELDPEAVERYRVGERWEIE